jgi:hypothetical protein
MKKGASDLVFRKFLTSVSVAAICSGCSLLFHADASQCTTNAECAAHGFAGYTCQVETGTCVANTVSTDAGMQSGPDSSMAMEASVGSSDASQVMEAAADTAPPPPANYCTSSNDCPGSIQHPEAYCDLDTNTCIQLTTDECPYVSPDDNPDYYQSSTVQPIFIGAFATIPTQNILLHPSTLNYNLALDEFETQGGIPVGSGGAYRYPVAVICNDDTTDPTSAVNHLISDVHVSAIIAALPSTEIKTAFAAANLTSDASAPSVFFMNPFGADTSITPPALQTNGLLWHMLGEPSDTAAAYTTFFPYVERYVRNTPTIGNGAADAGSRPLRVATFTAQATDLLDLQAAVNPVLTWNGGQTIAQNLQAGNFLDVEFPTSTLNGATVTSADVSSAVTALTNFQPDIVISFASEEFITLIQTLEEATGSGSAPPHPFYLLGPYNVDSTDVLTSWIGLSGGFVSDGKRARMAGIAFASTPNSDVLNSYNQRFINKYPGDQLFLNAENYYDAVYFTVYSLVGAGPNLTGANIGTGMTELVTPAGDPRNVGPTDIPNVIADLEAVHTTTVALTGTLGPPDFNLKTGARVSQGDVYCFNKYPLDAGAMAYQPYYAFDELRLVPTGGTATLSTGAPDTYQDGGPIMGLDGGAPPLEGTFDCYGGMFP